MNLIALREAVRHTMRGEAVDVSALDEATRAAFKTWKAQHSAERLAEYEPRGIASLMWTVDRPARSSEA
jgi:hypothetical protein